MLWTFLHSDDEIWGKGKQSINVDVTGRHTDITRIASPQYETWWGKQKLRTVLPSAVNTDVWNTKYGYLKQYPRNKSTNREGWKKNEEPNISTCAISRNISPSLFPFSIQKKNVFSTKSNTLSLVSKSVPVTLGYWNLSTRGRGLRLYDLRKQFNSFKLTVIVKLTQCSRDTLEQWFSNFFGSRRTVKHIKIFWSTSCTKLKIY
jgi:hypothetical protein